MPNLFTGLRRETDTLALWIIFSTWIFCFKLQEIATQINLKEGLGKRNELVKLNKFHLGRIYNKFSDKFCNKHIVVIRSNAFWRSNKIK
jgi:hypothetical protein